MDRLQNPFDEIPCSGMVDACVRTGVRQVSTQSFQRHGSAAIAFSIYPLTRRFCLSKGAQVAARSNTCLPYVALAS